MSLSLDDSFAVVADQLCGSAPAAIGKLGTIEFNLVYHLYLCKKHKTTAPLEEKYMRGLTVNAGMFPMTDAAANEIGNLLFKAIMGMTAVSPWWQIQKETELYDIFNKKAARIALQSLECFLSTNPAHWWTARLAPGTRVLVVSPFARSIMRQVKRLDAVWAARPGLWAKDLHFECLEFPLSFGIQSRERQLEMIVTYGSSAGLIEHFKATMDAVAYDVAIVGVGIHSLPLVAHARASGRRAIHTGGATQLYFGVRGGRWDTMPQFMELFNEHWIRPDDTERPVNLHVVERGCYW